MQIKPVFTPKPMEAIVLSASVIGLISTSIIRWEAAVHIPMIASIMLLWVYGLIKKIEGKQLEAGMIEGAKSGLGAVFLFFLIGLLVAGWMAGGTIPTLIYAAFNLVTPKFFYAVVFVVTAVIGVAAGSSLTTVASIGVAFISVAETFDLSLPITAGAIVSGAFFGDKMSPLSDTTNLASSMMKVDLFEHIRNISWTTVPAFFLSASAFMVLSPAMDEADFGVISRFVEDLQNSGLIHWYSWLPLLFMFILSLKKIPAIHSIAISSIASIALSFFHLDWTGRELMNLLFNGFASQTGNLALDGILSRGGINSMFFTVSLVILALSMGGLLFTLGIIPVLFASIEKGLRSVRSVITSSALTAIFINLLIGEQYLSILLTGKTYEHQYRKLGLANKNLSRVLEDAGTVVNPLVPWSVCGVFITGVLGVDVIEYLPYTFFCLLSPLLTILFGLTGKTLTFVRENQ